MSLMILTGSVWYFGIFNGKFNIPHPEISIITEDLLKQQSAFQSVYNSTEKLKLFGLDSEGIRKAQRNLLIQLQILIINTNLRYLFVVFFIRCF